MDSAGTCGPRRRSKVRTAFSIATLAMALLVCSALVGGAAAAPSRTIWDPDATPSWTLQINGSGASNDVAFAVVADRGGAYIAGYAGNPAGNADATLARVSAAGVRQWLKRYDGPAHGEDGIFELAKGPRGTLYGAGWSQNLAGNLDLLVVKWSASGRRLWMRRYDGPAHLNDTATALGVDRYGNVTVAGSSQSAAAGPDWIVVSWSSKGVKRWTWRRDGSAHSTDVAQDLLVSSGGMTYVTGYITVTGPTSAALTVKLSPKGRRLWSRTSRGTSSLGAAATAIARRPAGGVYVAGWTLDAATGADGLVMRYSGAGTGLALPPDVGAGTQRFDDVAVTTDRTVVAVGVDNAPGDDQGRVVLYSNEMSPGFGLSGGGAFDDAFEAVASDSFNGFYVSGHRGTGLDAQIWTSRLSAALFLGGRFESLWGPGLGDDRTYAIAVSGTTAYVVGRTHAGPAEGANQLVLAYIY